MLSIANPNARLQAFLGSAVTTDVKFTVGYFNMLPQTTADTARQLRTTIRTVSNGTSDVQIAPYPGQSSIDTTNITTGANNAVQNIFYVKAYNSNASSVTVTIQIEDGNDDIQIKATLGTLETLYYEDGKGWYSTDANGALKTTASAYVPALSAFMAWLNADQTNVTGNGGLTILICDTESYDVLGEYSTTTGVFTALAAGKYAFTAAVDAEQIPAGCTSCLLQILTSNLNFNVQTEVFVAGTWTTKQGFGTIETIMDAGDVCQVRYQFSGGAGDTADYNGQASATNPRTYFCGHRFG